MGIVELQKCVKCFQELSLDKFSEFIAVTKLGKEKRRRLVCYECNYKKVHYKSFHWQTATKKEMLQQLQKSFDKFVVRQEGCWNWKGFIRGDGYTRIRFGGNKRSIGGHVASWLLAHNIVTTNGLYILHKCDNKKCTNPQHLFMGTSQDNMIDMVQKEKSPHAKLSVKDVKVIKKLLKNGMKPFEICKVYNVHRETIADIKNGRTWKHVS